jgi:signal transduction histidine kinase
MRRLYLRIYIAMLAALALFSVFSAGAWWIAFRDQARPAYDVIQEVGRRIIPPAHAPPDAQAAELLRWRDVSGYELVLIDAGGRVTAATVGAGEAADVARHIAAHGHGRHPRVDGVWAVRLDDGRTLAALRPGYERRWRGFGWLASLFGIAFAIAVCAHPVVRRLTRRLERLEAGVAELGSGNLAARVPVEGRDEIARLAETFNRSAARIEALVTTNRSLLANASHELRSPLTRLRMGIERLSATAPPADRHEVTRNISELDQIIDEILTASRLDAQGAAALGREPVDVAGLVAEECARIGADFDAAGAHDAMLSADPRLLRRLTRNLLENAQRHGGPAIEAVLRREGSELVLDVLDRGPGVPEAERQRIFEPFYRSAGASERAGGVGLGLALVRQIAERHGGSARHLPRQGGGSRFQVRLPTADAARQP